MKNYIPTTEIHTIDSNKIRRAIGIFLEELNIQNSSTSDNDHGEIDFNELIEAYIKKPNSRKSINTIVKEHIYKN